MITYCTNIHPGESWAETFAALKTHVPPIKAVVSPDSPFPIGLRLSRRAAGELATVGIAALLSWLSEHDCSIPTINGFPFGSFHGARIKEQVYLPDWRSPERVEYTIRLADLLALLLPPAVVGSISTVPLGFRGMVEAGDLPLIRGNLIASLIHLDRIRQRCGKTIMLALEPEPGCLLETSTDVCCFFEELELPRSLSGLLGVCFDCCHHAVAFEDPCAALARLHLAGIPIAKVQVSSALTVSGADVDLLRPFAEPCYLHQVVIRRPDGSLYRYIDLPQALETHQVEVGEEWRCHFHVPIFHDASAGLRTTQPFLREFLPLLTAGSLLEVETYTWEVLPPELRVGSVDASIGREICWLKEQLDAAHRCP
jgi:hypothetical protein